MPDLQTEHEALLEFLYLCPVALVELGDDGDVRMMNPAGARLLMPLAPTGALHNLFDVLDPHLPELRSLARRNRTGRGPLCEGLRVAPGTATLGAPYPLVLSVSLVRVGADRLMAAIQDVSWSAAQAAAAREAEERLEVMSQGVRDAAVIVLDRDGGVRRWDDSACRLFGYSPAETLTRPLLDVLVPLGATDTDERLLAALEQARNTGTAELEGWLARNASTRFWGEVLITRRIGNLGRPDGFTAVVRDATRRRRERDDLLARANTDDLTGLANRRHFEELARREVERWHEASDRLCVAMVDADHFKRVNDTYGHATGDAALQAVARACRQAVRDIDLVARIGGEEFVVLMPQTDLVGAHAAAERIRASVAALEVRHDGHVVRLTVSVGVADIHDGDDILAVLERADAALYQAKEAGRDRVVVASRPKDLETP